MSQAETADDGADTGSVLYTLSVITLLVLLLGIGAAYGTKAWFDAQRDAEAEASLTVSHLKTVGAQRYALPAALMPDADQHRDGFAERVDLVFALPLGPEGRLSEIEMTLMPRGRVASSANLLDAVYMRQFGAEQLSGPQGLIGKPLDGDAGVSGETVWYDPLSATPFAAKCMTPVNGGAEARTCLRTVQLSDRNTAIFIFSPEVLENWRRFDALIEGWLDTVRK